MLPCRIPRRQCSLRKLPLSALLARHIATRAASARASAFAAGGPVMMGMATASTTPAVDIVGPPTAAAYARRGRGHVRTAACTGTQQQSTRRHDTACLTATLIMPLFPAKKRHNQNPHYNMDLVSTGSQMGVVGSPSKLIRKNLYQNYAEAAHPWLLATFASPPISLVPPRHPPPLGEREMNLNA